MKIEDHKLLPCPFCGGEAKMLQAAFENEEIAPKYPNTVGIRCTKCLVSTMPLSQEDAIKLWNTRCFEIHADLAAPDSDEIDGCITKDEMYRLISDFRAYIPPEIRQQMCERVKKGHR